MIRFLKNYKLLGLRRWQNGTIKAILVNIKEGDQAKARLSDRNSKVSPKFIGSRYMLRRWHNIKNEVYDPVFNMSEI